MLRHLLEELERALDAGTGASPRRLALRGAAAALIGLAGLLAPDRGLGALVLVFGAYAIADGAVALALAAPGPEALAGDRPRPCPPIRALARAASPSSRPRGAIALRGLASLFAGGVALFWPRFTAGALLCVAASWAVAAGALELAAACARRAGLPRAAPAWRSCWLPLVEGALSIAFGALGFLAPPVGAIALGLWLGAYALVLGAVLLAAAQRARAAARADLSTTRR